MDGTMFVDSGTVLVRTVVVGTLAYLALVGLLRLAGKRTLSKWNAFDLVVTVAFGSTLATALLSKDTSLAQGVVAFALLEGLQWVITRLSVRYGVFQRWVKAETRLLSRSGQLRRDALSAVRANGSTALEDIEAVVLETDGTFSVIGQRGSSASAMSDVQGYCQ